MESTIQFWILLVSIVSCTERFAFTQQYPSENAHSILSKLFPHHFQKYEPLEGLDTQETKDDLQNLLEVTSRTLGKEKRNNNEAVDLRDSNPNVNEQFEKHINLVLQHVAKKLREIYITPRLGRAIEDNIECQRSRPPFAPRLGKKSAPLTPRMGRQAYDDKC